MDALELIKTIDGKVWAEEFCRVVGEKIPAIKDEQDQMLCWFANAIMVGYDKGRSDAGKEFDHNRDEMDRLRDVGRDHR